jgi:hypothetical protein
MTNFIQALPSQGSKHLPQLGNGLLWNSFQRTCSRALWKFLTGNHSHDPAKVLLLTCRVRRAGSPAMVSGPAGWIARHRARERRRRAWRSRQDFLVPPSQGVERQQGRCVTEGRETRVSSPLSRTSQNTSQNRRNECLGC